MGQLIRMPDYERGRCETCQLGVIVLIRTGRRFDARPSSVLVPKESGLWELEDLHVEHVCNVVRES